MQAGFVGGELWTFSGGCAAGERVHGGGAGGGAVSIVFSMNTAERGASIMPAEFLARGAGDMGVGKSCLLHQFTEKRFQEDQVRSLRRHSVFPLPLDARQFRP